MKKIALTLLIGLSLMSCNSNNRIYSENKELSTQMEWLKKDVRTFDVSIENTEDVYDLSLSFRYTEGFPYDVMKVNVIETSPSGKETTKEYDLKVREENGEYIGEVALDIWDSEHLIEANKKYAEKGKYSYKIEHAMPKDPVQMVMEIGVILDKK